MNVALSLPTRPSAPGKSSPPSPSYREPRDTFVASRPDWVPPKMPNFHSQPKQTTLASGETLGWSEFAARRHQPGSGTAYFKGSQKELLDLVQEHWEGRLPGDGRSNLDEVVVVPVPADKFMTTVVAVDQDTQLVAQQTRRRSHEEPYVRVSAQNGSAAPANFARVVLYSAATLAENNERQAHTDWEVVALLASPVENEPMDPVTMMRNMRGKPGGSQVDYSAEQLLDSIEFWSKHVKLAPGHN